MPLENLYQELGNLEAQKYQQRGADVAALGSGIINAGKNILSSIDQRRVEDALSGDFNSILTEAKNVGAEDHDLNAAVAISRDGSRESKMKSIEFLHNVLKVKSKTSKFAKASEALNNLINDNTLTDEEKQNKAAVITSADPELHPLMAEFRLTLASQKAKEVAKKDESKSKMRSYAKEFALINELTAEQGDPEAAARNAMKLANANLPKFLEFINNKDAELGKNSALAAESLMDAIPANKRERPTAEAIFGVKPGEVSEGEKEDLKISSVELQDLIDSFKPEYANIAPVSGIADLINKVSSKFGSDSEAADWWRNMRSWYAQERHALFGGSFTAGESELWKQMSVDPSQGIGYIKDALKYSYNKIKNAQDIKIKNAKEKGVKRSYNSLYIPPFEGFKYESPKVQFKGESTIPTPTPNKNVGGGTTAGSVKEKYGIKVLSVKPHKD